MTRSSDKTDDEILALIENSGFTRIEGTHLSNNSIHTIMCNNCKMIFEKKSKSFVAGKTNCKFIPCSKRGKLSLKYVREVSKNWGIYDVWHPLIEHTEIDRLQISLNDKLRFTRGSEEMNQTWHEVRTRALGPKNGMFFIPDDKRRTPSAKLQLSDIQMLCKSLNLVPPSKISSRNKVENYVHQPCGHTISLRYSQLIKWREKKCIHCTPLRDIRLLEFQEKLKYRGFDFSGKIHLKANSSQVDRSIKYSIRCNYCQNQNLPRTYDWIFYRGYLFCDNPTCINTYDEKDLPNQSKDYYVKLFRDSGINSFVEAQHYFPRSATYIKRARIDNKHSNIGEMYRYVRNQLNWEKNRESKDFTKNQIKEGILKSIKHGETSVDGVLRAIDPYIYNYLVRQKDWRQSIFLKILDEIGFKYQHTHEINSIDDAIVFIKASGCASWSELTSQYPGFTNTVMALGFKKDLFIHFKWKHLANYSNKSDEELIREALQTIKEHDLKRLESLGGIAFGLLKNLRNRKLIKELCDKANISLPMDWRSFSYQKTLHFVKNAGILSLTDFHAEYVGLYKHASRKGWLEDINKDMSWHKYKGFDGYSYDSMPETIVANTLFLSGINYERQPSIESFRGMYNGKSKADFLLNNTIWVEVWAFARDDLNNYIFDEYSIKRVYKEKKYHENQMQLIGIEGYLYYRKAHINGTEMAKGLDSIVQHVLFELSKFGYKTPSLDFILSQFRASIPKS